LPRRFCKLAVHLKQSLGGRPVWVILRHKCGAQGCLLLRQLQTFGSITQAFTTGAPSTVANRCPSRITPDRGGQRRSPSQQTKSSGAPRPCHYAFRSVLPSRETQIKFGCFSQQATWNLASQKMIEAREKADRVAKPRALAMTRATSFGSRATLAACASPARNTCCTHAYDMGCLAAEYAAWFPRSQCDKGQVQ
jgi:hypothetical protein